MKVLVACEFSGIVRDAFIKRGHDAVSCDILPTAQCGPHIEGDVLDILDEGWDLMIAHPPCTFLSRAGARWLYPKGTLDSDRYEKLLKGRSFFMKLLNAPIPKKAVENPTPFKIAKLPEPTQVIQPFMFGEPYSKRTLLWLEGLEPLQSTDIIHNHSPWLPSNTSGFRKGQLSQRGKAKNASEYSLTFPGIAKAMANQWG